MARERQAVSGTLKGEAMRVRAKRELADLEQTRFVAKALGEGASHESVAEALGVSQPTISRLAARVKSKPGSLKPSVTEVVNRAAAKEISRARMLRELQGLLTRADARQIAEESARRFVARVTGSMELEDQAVQEPDVAQLLRETTDRMVSSLV